MVSCEALLLNLSGNFPLYNRFRATFMPKALKNEEAAYNLKR